MSDEEDRGAARGERDEAFDPVAAAMRREDEKIRQRMAAVRHKLVVLSGKGGVGKSLVAAGLASALAERGFRTGLVDVDIHGPDIPLILGVQGQAPQVSNGELIPITLGDKLHVMSVGFLLEDERTPIIWRGPLKARIIRQFLADVAWGELDFLVVDNPPGTGDEPLTVAQSVPPPAGAIVVTLPNELSLLDCRKAVNFARSVGMEVLGVVENMSGFVCPRCGARWEIFGRGAGERMAAEMGVPFIGRVPVMPEVQKALEEGKPIVRPGNHDGVAAAFRSLADALLVMLRERFQ